MSGGMDEPGLTMRSWAHCAVLPTLVYVWEKKTYDYHPHQK